MTHNHTTENYGSGFQFFEAKDTELKERAKEHARKSEEEWARSYEDAIWGTKLKTHE